MATIALNDKIFTQVALQAFVAKLAPLNAFTRDFSGDARRKGDAVIVPLISGITATTFNNSYEVGGGAITFATVNVNNHRIASIDLTDVQVANSSAAVMDNLAIQAGESLARIVLQDIWSAITVANFGAAILTTAGANYTIAQMGALRKALAQRNVPTDRLSFISDSEIYTGLLTSSGVAQALNYGGGEREYYDRLLAGYPQREHARFITPSEVAELIWFLAQPAAAPITGANLSIDFGLSAGIFP